MGQIKRQFLLEWYIAHQPLLMSENKMIILSFGKNIGGMFFRFVTKHTRDGQANRRTDEITIANTALALAASCGNGPLYYTECAFVSVCQIL